MFVVPLQFERVEGALSLAGLHWIGDLPISP
jgi:hypothetical protein